MLAATVKSCLKSFSLHHVFLELTFISLSTEVYLGILQFLMVAHSHPRGQNGSTAANKLLHQSAPCSDRNTQQMVSVEKLFSVIKISPQTFVTSEKLTPFVFGEISERFRRDFGEISLDTK